MEEKKPKTREQILDTIRFLSEDKPEEREIWQNLTAELGKIREEYTALILESIANSTGEEENEYNSALRERLVEYQKKMAELKERADAHLDEYVCDCISLIKNENLLGVGTTNDATIEERKQERQQLIDILTASALDSLSSPQAVNARIARINEVNAAYGYFPQLAIETAGKEK